MSSNLKTPLPVSSKILILGFLFLFLLLLIVRSTFLPPSPPTSPATTTTISDTNSQDSPALPPPLTCNKTPPSLARALVHYANTKVTPQQTLQEVSVSLQVLIDKSPCNFLVFGLGHDSLMWSSLNHGGRTVFLEENESWIRQIAEKFPSLEAYHVQYPTEVHQWKELLNIGLEKPCLEVTDPRLSLCGLAHKGLPEDIYDVEWDLIMVDAPTGYHDKAPGRMMVIYTAGLMARNRGRGETDVFLHDVNRPVEDEFSRAFLCERVLEGAGGSTPALHHSQSQAAHRSAFLSFPLKKFTDISSVFLSHLNRDKKNFSTSIVFMIMILDKCGSSSLWVQCPCIMSEVMIGVRLWVVVPLVRS